MDIKDATRKRSPVVTVLYLAGPAMDTIFGEEKDYEIAVKKL